MKIGITLLIAAQLLTACGSSASSSVPPRSEPPMASAAASPDLPSPTPQAAPTATSTPPPQIAVDGLAVVVTNDLVVRSLPEISARSVIDPRTLNEGKALFVLDGPVAADGFEWYQVVPFDTGDVAYPAPELGWVAAGRGREVWIAPEAAMEYRLCRERRAEEVLAGQPLVHLGCTGDKTISMVGRVTDCGEATGGGIGPVWLSARACQLVGLDDCMLACGQAMHHEEDGRSSG
jgi:hypothetical protein